MSIFKKPKWRKDENEKSVPKLDYAPIDGAEKGRPITAQAGNTNGVKPVTTQADNNSGVKPVIAQVDNSSVKPATIQENNNNSVKPITTYTGNTNGVKPVTTQVGNRGGAKSATEYNSQRGKNQKYDDSFYMYPEYWDTIDKKYPRVVYKRLVEKKLTIILVENTAKVVKEKDNLIKIVRNLVPSGLVCIINYGSFIKQSEIREISTFDDNSFLCEQTAKNFACLYDALDKVEKLVKAEYMVEKEKEKEKEKITQIEIIGIGTCTDMGSIISKEHGIECLYRVIRNPSIITKYFCLTDETFIDAAEMGFRSIGAISRSYQ